MWWVDWCGRWQMGRRMYASRGLGDGSDVAVVARRHATSSHVRPPSRGPLCLPRSSTHKSNPIKLLPRPCFSKDLCNPRPTPHTPPRPTTQLLQVAGATEQERAELQQRVQQQQAQLQARAAEAEAVRAELEEARRVAEAAEEELQQLRAERQAAAAATAAAEAERAALRNQVASLQAQAQQMQAPQPQQLQQEAAAAGAAAAGAAAAPQAQQHGEAAGPPLPRPAGLARANMDKCGSLALLAHPITCWLLAACLVRVGRGGAGNALGPPCWAGSDADILSCLVLSTPASVYTMAGAAAAARFTQSVWHGQLPLIMTVQLVLSCSLVSLAAPWERRKQPLHPSFHMCVYACVCAQT